MSSMIYLIVPENVKEENNNKKLDKEIYPKINPDHEENIYLFFCIGRGYKSLK